MAPLLRVRPRGAGLVAALSWLACVSAARGGPAAAPPPEAPATVESNGVTHTVSELQAAEILFQAGKLAEARIVLDHLLRQPRPANQALFLRATIAVQDKDLHLAIRLYRRILVRDPRAVRVRLELGRVYFVDKSYAAAERQFRLALAGKLPDATRTNINGYLYAIRQAHTLTYDLTVAVAPDTNLNAGPTIQTLSIYGLPFQLNDQARRQSGVGVAVDTNGQWSPLLAPNLRLRIGAQAHTLDFGQSEFDDSTLSAFVGPQWFSSRWDISPVATYYVRWYGNRFYNDGAGGAVQANYYATPRIILSDGITGQYITYGPPSGQSGPAVSATTAVTYTLSPVSFITARLSVSRQWAGLAVYANTALQAQLEYSRDLPLGFTASLTPSWVELGYDAPLAAFNARRRDHQLGVEVTMLNRRIDIYGFTPRLLYAYTNNRSDIPLYSYQRNHFEFGLTRLF